jgi:hypothetical protein
MSLARARHSPPAPRIEEGVIELEEPEVEDQEDESLPRKRTSLPFD